LVYQGLGQLVVLADLATQLYGQQDLLGVIAQPSVEGWRLFVGEGTFGMEILDRVAG
jgi:hypothetical protein